jgi:BirA family transcriptional regulator, biotin operon repressor / biotin---[acetyl-CoA-carboxylase] ligase
VTATPPADLLPADFREAVSRRLDRLAGFASAILWYDTVSSTNDIADRAAANGAPHGTVVAADFQEAGRGRMGRSWYSPPGAGLYVSVILRPRDLGDAFGRQAGGPPSEVARASSITLTAGVAIAEALRGATGLDAAIKWPNDLVVGGRKICGILAEAAAGPAGLHHVVLGYGVNVLPAAYPPEIAERATSIEAEIGRPADRAAVFAESLACLAERLRELSAGGLPVLLDRWRALSPSSLGRPVEVVSGQGWLPGTTAGIDVDGALLVAAGGTTRRVIAGEVRWLSF